MRQSQLFVKTTKEFPKEEPSMNSQLLIRAGFVDKLMAGVYSFLPLGFRVLKKVENIIRQEMNEIGAQEVILPVLHPKENWQRTGRWQQQEMFKLKNRAGKDYSLGWTHEEIITPLVKKFIQSYKDLPLYIYQIQDKFRDELRVKSGLLRGVEFIMKDLYSFHRDEKDLDDYYKKVSDAYFKIFERCGIKNKTYLTLASGGTFSKYSHEFQTLAKAGEDTIYICQKCDLAINKEIKNDTPKCPNCGGKDFKEEKAIEVGNIFKLGTKYSSPFDLKFRDSDAQEKMVVMGCYGIGLSRLIGAVVETNYDEKGIIWPAKIAPFKFHLIYIENTPKVKEVAEKLYKDLQLNNIELLYDDREDKTAGEKFADADLIGIPIRMIVSEKTLKQNSVEIKRRHDKEIQLIKIQNIKSEILKEA